MPGQTSRCDTTVRFWPDPKFFDTDRFAPAELRHTLKAKAVLCPGLKVRFENEATGEKEEWFYTGALAEYLAGARRTFDLPIELSGLSAWDRTVLDGVRGIPYGSVTSYGRLARLIGRPGAARGAAEIADPELDPAALAAHVVRELGERRVQPVARRVDREHEPAIELECALLLVLHVPLPFGGKAG